MTKWVYNFSEKNTEGSSEMSSLLGNKGAHLAQMCKLGIAVPPGFTISTDLCQYYYSNNQDLPDDFVEQLKYAILEIENNLNLNLGCDKKPLLLSVRSGSSVSMPGMMDTILNLGLNDVTVEALSKNTSNKRFAYDCYRRFIQMYASVVLGVNHQLFEDIIEEVKSNINIKDDNDLTSDDLEYIVARFKEIILVHNLEPFPQDVHQQLLMAIRAVLNSWMNERAIAYRQIHNLPDDIGTAVNIQAMVFGNIDNNSATGVVFTRNPSDGDNAIFGEYLINAQGEDVVSGIRTPQSITKKYYDKSINFLTLEEHLPHCFKSLVSYLTMLEKHYKDMQDVEFTIEQNKLWILQTRNGKRSANAAIKIAVDLVNEAVLTKEQALCKIEPNSLSKLLHADIDDKQDYKILAKGLPASPGAAMGRVYFDAQTAELMSRKHDVILVRKDTSPEDIKGMNAAKGILTSKGGMTSHAAVVARGMGKSCVCGAQQVVIDYKLKECRIGDALIKEGDVITINGSTGDIILGEVKMIMPEINNNFHKIMKWSSDIRRLSVRVNAETKKEVQFAKNFYAQGIGLCRTEHMFFEEDRIDIVRQMILSENENSRSYALEKLLHMQTIDFIEIFKIMEDHPINVRLLDPPLHEFLPHCEQEIIDLARKISINVDILRARILSLREQNPMLGHRGCRLGITYPEIYQMQAKAIFNAMKIVHAEQEKVPQIEIMVPLTITQKELELVKDIINKIADEVLGNNIFDFKIGSMIELPRACIIADEIASSADFLSFGTNDLTQTTLGISRDDIGAFINEYFDHKIFTRDPFVTIDKQGVGSLMEIAIKKARSVKQKIKIGICGEHAGDPESISFFESLDIDYVSCSPYRLPIAMLAAAQATIKAK